MNTQITDTGDNQVEILNNLQSLDTQNMGTTITEDQLASQHTADLLEKSQLDFDGI